MRSILWLIVVLLLVFWILGQVLWVAGGLIHLILVIIVIIILLDFLGGRRDWW